MGNREHKEALEAVRQLAGYVGGKCWVMHQVGQVRGSAGIPDTFLVLPRAVGLVIDDLEDRRRRLQAVVGRDPEARVMVGHWHEVKTERDKLREGQADFQTWVRQAGMSMTVGRVSKIVDHFAF